MAMNSHSRLLSKIQTAATLIPLLFPPYAFAYGRHLTDETVRDAYFLGQDADRSAQFLAQYLQSLPVPDSGPHISQIELRTPYAQVVAVSREHPFGYSAQQANADYRSRGDTLWVRVLVMFTPTYTNRAPDFWRSVSVGLVQKEHTAAQSVSGQPIYATDHDGDYSWVIGANVYVLFPAKPITSDSVDVEVVPPEGPKVRASFDLGALP
jgi:hypothetical protein